MRRSGREKRSFVRRAIPVAVVLAVVVPALALAHIERASYWPDPAADTTVNPPAGGQVPTAKSLASALSKGQAGRTRVVCQSYSTSWLKRSIRNARRRGYFLRPTDHRRFSAREAKRVLDLNARLAKRCRYHEIQPAITASHNNDRVVIMPGIYTEPTARKAKTHDPACAKYTQGNDRGENGAVSYEYQTHCPNDQNLVAVIGRAVGKGQDPQPPRMDRHGVPNLGPCIRCNVQVEGSGVSPDDVVIDAGRVASGNHAPIGAVKDVGFRIDRADGFVLRNMTVRHADEHDVYILESDGFFFDRIKTFYGGEYGILTFVEDHGLIQNCEAAGNGDSGVYPGAAAETGEQRAPGETYRYNQEIRWCDSRHNALGYSGTDGNAVHIHDNNFYDNAEGFSTDVFTAAGHPGFPQDSDLIEHNNFYSNNFNPYVAGSDIKPSVPVPVGSGLWIAGGNNNTIRDNRFYDNWRRGTMLFAVEDAFVCGTQSQEGCNPGKLSTSYRNKFYGNIMGVAPDGSVKPNGTDFWWDSQPTNTANCWWGNTPAPGKKITSSPDPLPDCNAGKDPSSSMGTENAPAHAELVSCLADIEFDVKSCNWFTTPPKPSP
jgi:hypothetical protein